MLRFAICSAFTVAFALLAGCASAAPDVATHNTPRATPGTPEAPPHAPLPANPPAPAAMQTLTLNIGEQTKLPDGSQLAYTQLINDSRCPPNVQCIWAGSAEIELRYTPTGKGKGKPITFSLHTNPMQGSGQTGTNAGKYRIALMSLERGIAPKATVAITALP